MPVWDAFAFSLSILGDISESPLQKLRGVFLELYYSCESWSKSNLTYGKYFCDLDRKKNHFLNVSRISGLAKMWFNVPLSLTIRLLWNAWMSRQELEIPKSLLKTHPVLNPGRSKQKIILNLGENTTSQFQEKAFM